MSAQQHNLPRWRWWEPIAKRKGFVVPGIFFAFAVLYIETLFVAVRRGVSVSTENLSTVFRDYFSTDRTIFSAVEIITFMLGVFASVFLVDKFDSRAKDPVFREYYYLSIALLFFGFLLAVRNFCAGFLALVVGENALPYGAPWGYAIACIIVYKLMGFHKNNSIFLMENRKSVLCSKILLACVRSNFGDDPERPEIRGSGRGNFAKTFWRKWDLISQYFAKTFWWKWDLISQYFAILSGYFLPFGILYLGFLGDGFSGFLGDDLGVLVYGLFVAGILAFLSVTSIPLLVPAHGLVKEVLIEGVSGEKTVDGLSLKAQYILVCSAVLGFSILPFLYISIKYFSDLVEALSQGVWGKTFNIFKGMFFSFVPVFVMFFNFRRYWRYRVCAKHVLASVQGRSASLLRGRLGAAVLSWLIVSPLGGVVGMEREGKFNLLLGSSLLSESSVSVKNVIQEISDEEASCVGALEENTAIFVKNLYEVNPHLLKVSLRDVENFLNERAKRVGLEELLALDMSKGIRRLETGAPTSKSRKFFPLLAIFIGAVLFG